MIDTDYNEPILLYDAMLDALIYIRHQMESHKAPLRRNLHHRKHTHARIESYRQHLKASKNLDFRKPKPRIPQANSSISPCKRDLSTGA